MIRLACALVLVSLATLVAMIARTEASTAILFGFVGHGSLALGIAAYAWHLWGPVEMSEDERRLYELAFSTLDRREFLKLVVLGEWEDAQAGEKVVRKGQSPDHIRVLLRGRIGIDVDGERIGELEPGQLVGTAFVIAEEPSWADGVALEPCRMLSWHVGTIDAVIAKRPQVRATLNAIVSKDLATKLQTLTRP